MQRGEAPRNPGAAIPDYAPPARRSIRPTVRDEESTREARAAGAGGGGVGVGDLERGADQIIDERNFRAFQVAQRDRIDQDFGALARDHEVVGSLALLHVEAVLEPGAAAAYR